MKNILNKKLNRKGFTLAELLIVVAIIAILVAIALPLFFGALDNARKATFEANKRSLKAAGVAYLLQNPNEIPSGTTKYLIKGKIDASGNITEVTVEAYEGADDPTTQYSVFNAPTGDTKADIQVLATNTDVQKAGSVGP